MHRSTNKQKGYSITMHAAPLSISTLYSQIERASNKEMADAITQAFEQLEANQKEALVQNKQETLKEVNPQDLATKADLENLRLATKADLENLRLTTKADIENLRVDTKASIQNLETKMDLKMTEQKLELHKEISSSKWQVIGSMAALFFVQTLAKHFGWF